MIIPPGVSHCPLFSEHFSPPYERIVLWVNLESFKSFLNFDVRSDKSYIRHLHTAETSLDILGEYFEKGCRESDLRRNGWEAFVLGNSLCILTFLMRAIDENPQPAVTAESHSLLDGLLSYIDKNLNKRLVLPEMASLFAISESTISKLFRSRMDISFYRYVTKRRLIAAKTLIGMEIALEDIPSRIGYGDYSSFYRSFKKEYGISPTQYRSMVDRNTDLKNLPDTENMFLSADPNESI